jgi:SPP1 gp7 family putative phage head morphogenesis protein
MHANARTVAVARLLRAAAPVMYRRKGGRMPRQQQPDLIRLEYFKAIMPIIERQIAQSRGDRSEILQLLIEERRDRGLTEDIDRKQRAEELVAKAGRASALAFRPREVSALAEKFAKRTGDFNRVQLDRQVRQAVGVPFESIEKPIRDLVPIFAKTNVELVKTVPERYHDRLAADVREAFETGMHPETLAERFVELDDMAENDARRIARDQIGKLNANFNQERQEAMGVTEYDWHTVNDQRVRDNHAFLDGQRFSWDDPPMGGGTNDEEPGNPGEGIQCRCSGDPVFDDIIADLS